MINDIIALAQGQHWLALIALATLILRKWTSSASSFPITIPQRWQGTVTAAGGLVYGLVSALQAGTPWQPALIGMAVAAGASGFLDGLLVAVFNHDAAPGWARAIVFVFDDLTKPTNGTKAGPMGPPGPQGPPGPPASPPADFRKAGAIVLAMLVAFASGCGLFNQPLPPHSPLPADVEADIVCVIAGLEQGKNFDQLEAGCLPGQSQTLVEILAILFASKGLADEHPAAAANLPRVMQIARQQGYRTTSEKP
jgi:hypothetical protein